MRGESWAAGRKAAVLTVNGVTVQDTLLSVTYTDDLNGDGSAVTLGATAAASVTIVVDTPSVTYTGAAITLSIGGVPLGVFTVVRARMSEDSGRLTVEAVDAMAGAAMAADYVPDDAETALEVIAEIADGAGLTLAGVSGVTGTGRCSG